MRRLAIPIAFGFLVACVHLASPQNLPFPGSSGVAGHAAATFDPATNTNSGTLTNGNLTYQVSTTNAVRSTLTSLSKACFTLTVDSGTAGTGNLMLGVIDNSQATVTPTSVGTTTIKIWGMRDDALAVNNGASGAYGVNFGTGAVKTICFDNTLGSGSGKVWVGVCSAGTLTFPNSGSPAAGTNAMFSNLTGSIAAFVNFQSATGTPKVTANFGQSAPACSYPAGYSNL